MKTRLVIDDNTVYEIDEDCLDRKKKDKNSCCKDNSEPANNRYNNCNRNYGKYGNNCVNNR